jgi:hypothetical protein
MKVNFSYNLDKDIQNFLIGKKSVGGREHPSRLQKLYEEKNGPEVDTENLRKFIIIYSEKNKIDFKKRAIIFQKAWAEINNEFFYRTEKIFQTKLPTENITGYLTVNDRCGYNPGQNGQWYFFITAGCQQPRRLCAHEIFHFFTHLCFEKWLRNEVGLTPKEFYDLKESLNEILNCEFADLLDGSDKPNSEYQIPIRQKIKELWQKEKDIKKVVEKMIKK